MSKPELKRILKASAGIVSGVLVFVAMPARAVVSQEGWDPNAIAGSIAGKGLPDPQGGFFTILLTFIDWAVILIGILGVIVFIYGGFIYLTAQGETDNLERAKKIILYAIVGIAVSVLGLVAVRTIDSIMRGTNPVGTGTASPTGTSPAVTTPGTQTAAPSGQNPQAPAVVAPSPSTTAPPASPPSGGSPKVPAIPVSGGTTSSSTTAPSSAPASTPLPVAPGMVGQ